MVKVKIGFNRKPVPYQIARTRHILGALNDNDNYKDPKPGLAVIKTANDKLEKAYNNSRSGDTNFMAEMKRCRKELIRLINLLAAYVQVESGGDAEIILSSGFDLEGKRTRIPDTAGKIFNLRLQDGQKTGSVIARWEAAENAVMYIIKVSLSKDFSNPVAEYNTTTTQKEFGQFKPGTKIWVQVFAYGRENPGDPSQPMDWIVR